MPKTTRKLASVLPNVLGQTLSKDTFALSDTLPPVSFLQHCFVVQQNESDSATLEKLRSAKKVVRSPSPAPSICFVDRTADLEVAAQSVLEAAFAFEGSSPYAPNVFFVHEAVEKDFSATLKQYAGPDPGFSSAGRGSPSEEEKRLSMSRPSVGAEEKASIREIVLNGPRGRIVYLHQGTKGLDDALNWAEEVIGDPFRTAAGAFIFASSHEANYLVNAMNADVTCINSFPPELLVGSRWPRPMKINAQDPSTLLLRYAREIFEDERVVVLGPSPVSRLCKEKKMDVFDTAKNATGPMAEWVKRMELPLNPTNQRLGGRRDFFEGALLTTVLTVVLPAWSVSACWEKLFIARLDGRHCRLWKRFSH
ncbi:hypothetical protein LTR91_024833 [Friedmanniomyces endolithicus]|uniref:Aldehyde dehydrogenase domain-containing protein n=1 Tax=Friedmanniomyces endolithicus TaxID=329885 RepID=A0AAN6H6B7_9PEZI|nr:hypothetical protein LTS09_017338 [Friedmanniomyces endolithicus]KAK0890258.1 hypothetical protein LTR57_025169 [Friedmanniomyces endolithicus]KAK0951686.1 hypothetical protein LTS01_025143 [Friedmanniomyces endolithicus]KAK0951707.1 hypothetical protein LTR91_024833 [Friedmanniomyces endolithicus]KAK1021581.1 hypothetical protein LTS16_026402 [Friedmanniomyces endolithicus]